MTPFCQIPRDGASAPFPPAGAHVSGILDDVFRSQQLLQSANYWCFWLPESKYGNERYRFSTSRGGAPATGCNPSRRLWRHIFYREHGKITQGFSALPI